MIIKGEPIVIVAADWMMSECLKKFLNLLEIADLLNLLLFKAGDALEVSVLCFHFKYQAMYLQGN